MTTPINISKLEMNPWMRTQSLWISVASNRMTTASKSIFAASNRTTAKSNWILAASKWMGMKSKGIRTKSKWTWELGEFLYATEALIINSLNIK